MIYLDYNTTTPVGPQVLAAMLPLFGERFASPASSHAAGRAVADQVYRACHQVSELLGAADHDVLFTTGATEAARLAVRGVLDGPSAQRGRRRVLVGATEHPAVLQACRAATAGGRGVLTSVAVRADGGLDLEHLRSLLDENVALVVVMAANHETGAVNDLREVGRLAHGSGALLLSDVAQAAGKIRLALADWGVDLAVLSAHKLYGPKGIGALVTRRDIPGMGPPALGAGPAGGLPACTTNAPGIVGFGAAAQLAGARLGVDTRRMTRLRQLLYDLLAQRLEAVAVNGNQVTSTGQLRGGLPNTLNLRFTGAPASAVMACAAEVAVATGAGCPGGAEEPSPVLLAMGCSRGEALESVRFSLGRPTTPAEVRRAAAVVAAAVEHVRGLRGAMARWRGDARGAAGPW